MPAKIQRVQYLRAAAALSVVLAHAIGDYKAMTGLDLLPLHYLGAAGVDLFFVISGFIMVQSSTRSFGVKHAAATFLTRRWFRIAPLYWIVMAGYALLQIAQGKWYVIDPVRIVASALFFPIRSSDGSMAPFYGIGWTLNYEMFFYAVFAVWLGVRRRIAVPGIALTIFALVVVGQLSVLEQPLATWFNPIILDFLFGVLIAMAFERGWSIPSGIALPLIAVAVAAVGVGGAYGFNATLPETPTAFPRWIAWGIPSAAIVVAVTLCRDDAFERLPTIGRHLGDASYSMYLLHPIVIILMRSAVPTGTSIISEPFQVMMGAGHIAAVVAIVALLSMASFMVLERPIIRLGIAVIAQFRPAHSAVGHRARVEADI